MNNLRKLVITLGAGAFAAPLAESAPYKLTDSQRYG